MNKFLKICVHIRFLSRIGDTETIEALLQFALQWNKVPHEVLTEWMGGL